MQNKISKKIIIFFVLFSLILGVSSVLTQKAQAQSGGNLEVTYPTIASSAPPISVKTYLPHYIKYIYHFFIVSGGIIALLVIIFGGFRFLTSTGNPSVLSDAKNQIFSGLLGLVILFGSFIILNEINPDLVSLKSPTPQGIRTGIILYSTSTCANLGAEASIPELVVVPSGVLYKAMQGSGSAVLQKDPERLPLSLFSFASSTELGLELFSTEDCSGDPFHVISNLQANSCYDLSSAGVTGDVRCIKMDWNRPGVWVFHDLDHGKAPNPTKLPENWSEGKEYTVFNTSQSSLKNPFNDHVMAIALVPDVNLKQNFGVVLHNIPGGLLEEKGWASIYLPGESSKAYGGGDQCTVEGNITMCGPFNDGRHHDVSSITVFTVPQPGSPDPTKAVTVCRNDSCKKQTIGGKDYSASIRLIPNDDSDGLHDITTFFGGNTTTGGNLFFKGNNTVFARSFEGPPDGDKWKYTSATSEDITLGARKETGIEAVKIDNGAHYLVLLYRDFFGKKGDTDGLKELNERAVDAAITNIGLTSLSGIRLNMKNDVGTIVVIKLGESSGKQ